MSDQKTVSRPEDIRPGALIPGGWRVIRELGMDLNGSYYHVRNEEGTERRMFVPTEVFLHSSPGGFLALYQDWMRLDPNPNILRCHTIRNFAEGWLVFMEWANGGSLLELVKSGRFYEGTEQEILARVLDVGIQSLRGLAEIHLHQIVHGDVKPEQMLLHEDGTLKLTNVGLLTGHGFTPAYAAPEVMQGEKATAASDRYSWAVMMVELLMGKMTWRQGKELVCGKGGLKYLFKSPRSKVPILLRGLLEECLTEKPEDREKNEKLMILMLEKFYAAEMKKDYETGEALREIITVESEDTDDGSGNGTGEGSGTGSGNTAGSGNGAGADDFWASILNGIQDEAAQRINEKPSEENDGLTPGDDGTIPEDEVKIPEVSGISSDDYGTIWDDDGTVPEDDGTIPEDDGTIPEDDGTIPEEDGTVPEDDGTIPEDDGTLPEDDGTLPEDKNAQTSGFDPWADILKSALMEAQRRLSNMQPEADNNPTPAQKRSDEMLTEPEKATEMDSTDIRKGETLLETYHVESDAFEGGMGAVWRVHHTGWDVDLALKRPKSSAFRTEKQKKNFTGECEAWINLGLHPNIVACYYVREIEGVPAIFSEWMENGSVEDHIKDGSLYVGSRKEVQERLLDIAIQFARGLHYAHENGLIHQDVKPDNLLVTDHWEAKVSDFGLAKARASLSDKMTVNLVSDDVTMITPSGGKTPAYCSPEQAASKRLTRRTDIYSWAVSILEMYLGRKPWAHGRELTGQMVGVVCEDYFAMCQERPIPNTMQELLKKCLAQETKNRPRDFASVEKTLLKIYHEVTGKDYPRPAPKAFVDNADSLNNRALSFLDLERPEEAERLWARAALKDPAHTNSLFNRTLYALRNGKMKLYEAQCFLSANWENHFSEAEPGLLLAAVSLEFGDHKTVESTLRFLGMSSANGQPLSEKAYAKVQEFASHTGDVDYHCAWQLSRIRSLRELDEVLRWRDEKLSDLKKSIKNGKHYDQAAQQLVMIQLDPSKGDAIYQPDWMAFYQELTRHCMPVHITSNWPVMRIPDMNKHKQKVSFSDDSRLLLCDQQLYDMETGELIRDNGKEAEEMNAAMKEMRQLWINMGIKMDDEPKGCYCSRLSPDGSFYLRTMLGDHNFQKIDARTGEVLADCAGHEEEITALAISRDGKRLASGDLNGVLHLWNADGSHLSKAAINMDSTEKLEDILFGYDNRKMILRYYSYVLIWDNEDGSIRRIPYDNYLEVDVDPEFMIMAMAIGREGLGAMDLSDNSFHQLTDDQKAAQGHGIYTPSIVRFLPGGRIIAFGDGKLLKFYDIPNRKLLTGIHMPDYVDDIAISRNGKYLAVRSGGQVQIWQFVYLLRYLKYDPKNPPQILSSCAWTQCAAHSGKAPKELVPLLMEELADRGYGCIPETAALEALETAFEKQKAI